MHFRNRLKYCVFWLLGVTASLPAIGSPMEVNSFDLPLKSAGSIAFYLDVCQFARPDLQTSVELSYSLDLQQFLHAEQQVDSLRFNIELTFLDQQMAVINHLSENKSLAYDQNGAESQNLTFIDLKKFLIAADTLQIRLEISDPFSKRSGEIETAIVIKKFGKRLSLSDILFVSRIQRAGDLAHFLRGGLTMIPNPARFYHPVNEQDGASVYVEVNNLTFRTRERNLYSMTLGISDLSGNQVLSKTQPGLVVKNENASRVEKIDLTNFDTGVYRLELRVVDLASGQSSAVHKYFRVFSDEHNNSMLLPMSNADIEKYLDQIKFIATETEKKVFLELDPAGKQAFLLKFWKSRDPDPHTPENEFMASYFSRISYCEANFQNGIDSDQARIYMQYGPPMDVQRMTMAGSNSKPVEIWIYALEGTTQFIFVDRMGGDQFVLVHSTHPDEYQNPDWQQQFQ